MPKICDFGNSLLFPVLRRSIDVPGARSAQLEAGRLRGTPRFMAPEVVLGVPITLPCALDIYSLGAILCDMAHIGTAPADAQTPPSGAPGETLSTGAPSGMQLLVQRARDGFAVTVQPHVPPALGAIILACMAVDPAARPVGHAVRGQLSALVAAAVEL